mmetsp:Transcript_32554/g.64866  ORF Transcript_32554/g.64866 Transcript_32554/m.64866 type:complete len:248 (+) Transcript_32554:683-1426(+)
MMNDPWGAPAQQHTRVTSRSSRMPCTSLGLNLPPSFSTSERTATATSSAVKPRLMCTEPLSTALGSSRWVVAERNVYERVSGSSRASRCWASTARMANSCCAAAASFSREFFCRNETSTSSHFPSFMFTMLGLASPSASRSSPNESAVGAFFLSFFFFIFTPSLDPGTVGSMPSSDTFFSALRAFSCSSSSRLRLYSSLEKYPVADLARSRSMSWLAMSCELSDVGGGSRWVGGMWKSTSNAWARCR